MADPVWFWQTIVSPHMAGLAAAMGERGQRVTYVAVKEMSQRRLDLGWNIPDLGAAQLINAPTIEAIRNAVAAAPADSIHICQGFRGNGLIGAAQHALAARGLRQWVVMERVDDAGWRGLLKRLEYRRLIRQWRPRIEGVLAAGHDTGGWLEARGMEARFIHPFAYFLPEMTIEPAYFDPGRPFRFLYVGQIIERKRIDLLLEALESLKFAPFELVMIGSGPLEAELKARADILLPGRVDWRGKRPMAEIAGLMAGADCLVLPSRHDGWGAVVSEALMAGTPAICSDRCGAAAAVHGSGTGGIFRANSRTALAGQLHEALQRGRQTPQARTLLANWATCLGAQAGADYLTRLLQYRAAGSARPTAPWATTGQGQTAI